MRSFAPQSGKAEQPALEPGAKARPGRTAGRHDGHAILALQRTIGNLATRRVVGARTEATTCDAQAPPERRDVAETAEGRDGPRPVVVDLQKAFGEDFSDVDVRHAGGNGGEGTFTSFEGGRDVVTFSTSSPTREQVAHELTHVTQRRKFGQGARHASLHSDAAEAEARILAARAVAGDTVEVRQAPQGRLQRDGDLAQRIHEDLHGWIDDEDGALAELRSERDRRALCDIYRSRYDVHLWDDFIANASGDTLHRALALLWPHMTVLQRLSTQLGFDDDEDGMLQTIETASDVELREARHGIQPYLDELDVPDQYTARRRIWPESAVGNVLWLLGASNGWIFDDEGPVATAILSLTPEQRASLWNEHRDAFGMFSDTDRARIGRMCVTAAGRPATDAAALDARMELATEGVGTDVDGVQAAIGVAGNRRDELARIEASLASGTGAGGHPLTAEERLTLQRRRRAIGDVGRLLATGHEGTLDEASFLGRVAGDTDAATLDAALTMAGSDAFTRAKQALLMTLGDTGIDVDEDAALLILRNVQGEVTLAPGESIDSIGADELLRRRDASTAEIRVHLRRDPDLRRVWAALDREERGYADRITAGDTYSAAIRELTVAFEGIDTDEAALLRIIRDLRPADRDRLRNESPPILGRIRRWGLSDAFYRALDAVLATGQIPAVAALDAAYGGSFDGTDEDMATDVLAGLNADQRTHIRRGYLLRHSPRSGSAGALDADDQRALNDYNALYARMSSEYTAEELDAALVTLIDLPTVREMQSDRGRIDAAGIMLARQRERLRMGGLTDAFTTTDDTAATAHVEFESRYRLAMEDGAISEDEFAVLVRLDEQFNRRFQTYADTVNQVAEIAGTVAAVVAAAVAIIASGGALTAATPGVIAWLSANSTVIATSAAAGALTQVVVTEAMGGEFNEATDAEGARQALSGALNGALAVAGAALAERAATLVGLSGRALTAQIARSAASATETSVAGRAFARGALTGLIDGSLSGSVGDLAMTLTDAQTWRRSVWGVLARAGESLLRGGLLGGLTGAAAGGLLERAQVLLRARAIRGCAVHMDDGLGSGAHIDFSVNADGSLDGLSLRFGPTTTDGDLAAHVESVVSIRRASRLLSRVRSLGTLGGEAAEEVRKIEPMIMDRLRQIRSGSLSPQSREIVEAELDVLQANLDEFSAVAARSDGTPGTGHIGRPDAPPGYPRPPEGHYYRRRETGWDLQRYPDADVEPHTLERTRTGRWRVVVREGATAAPAVYFPEGTTARQAFSQLTGADSQSSFKPFWEMLRDNGLASRDDVIRAMLDPSGRTEDAVRHALKEHFRPRVLARALRTPSGGLRTEAASLLELNRLTTNLNPSDKGNLTEAWYAARRGGLAPHPDMLPADNPGLLNVRRPDFVEGHTLVEVKSTATGVGERDVDQIQDMLGVCSRAGSVTLADGTPRNVSAMRLVFTDIRGARGSANSLARWLSRYPGLTIEVFGSAGARTQITQATLPLLRTRYGVSTLEALLTAL